MATITGSSGNDVLNGTSGDDTIFGLAGNDTLNTIGGTDFYDGGTGNDTFDLGIAGAAGVTVSFADGTISGGLSGTFVNVERVLGTGGADSLIGAAGNQNLSAKGGNDRLEGGDGNDTLWGGNGADSFVFREFGTANVDRVSDFASGADKIVLDAAVMSALGANGAFAAGDGRFAANSTGTAQDADDRVVFNTSTTQLFYDADGSGAGAAVLIATLQSGATLVATDIVAEGGSSGGSGPINGTEGNDTLTGTAGDDTINGLGGDDTLSGLDGDDRLDGGTGNDWLFGYLGADLIIGGEGNDTLRGDAYDEEEESRTESFVDTMQGGLGDDVFYVDSTSHVMSDDAGVDTVVALEVDWTLGAGFENLILHNDVSESSLTGIGNELDNVISMSYAGGHLEGRAGNDTLLGGGAETGNHLLGGDGDDSLVGSGGHNLLDGGAGQDILRTGAFRDHGDSSVFAFSVAPGAANADRIIGFVPDADTIQLDGSVFTNVGFTGEFSAGDARFHSGAGASAGHDADDRIIYDTSTGNLWHDADGNGAGAAQLIATLEGAPGVAATNIEIVNAPGLLIQGTEGNDSLVGTGSQDTINGLAGNDTIDGGREADSMASSITTPTAAVAVLRAAHRHGAGRGGGCGDRHRGDLGIAGVRMATINGTAGNDTLSGTPGNENDTINGGDGNDLFLAGSSGGNDVINGGGGRDSIEFKTRATSAIVVDFVAGTITGGSSGTITFTSIERVLTGDFNDTLSGNSAAQTLTGQGGADTIWGAGGVDTLWGGTGGDSFVFRETGTASADLISDFASGSDKIVLDARSMTALGASGNFAAGDARFVANSAGTAQDASDRIIYETDTRQVWYDPDGTGAAARQLIATLQVGATLVATDIVVEGGNAPSGMNITGTTADESLTGGPGDDTINGGGGSDTLTGAGGADRFMLAETPRGGNQDYIVDFAGGTDKLVLDSSALVNLGPNGDFAPDDPRFRVSSETPFPQDADDRVIYHRGSLYYDPDGTGVAPTRWLAFLQGAPDLAATDITVVGNGNPPTPQGTSGDDSLVGTDNPDTIDGGAGNDTIAGWDGNDVLIGGDGDDELSGGLNEDQLFGGDGNDTLHGGSDRDAFVPETETLDGGLGNDTYVVSRQHGHWSDGSFSADLVLQDAGGIDTIVANSGHWVLQAGFENLTLEFDVDSDGSTRGIGNELDNVIIGFQGWWAPSRIDGADGDDTLIGGDGNDRFMFAAGSGNIGNDQVDGDGGDDSLDYSGARSAVVIDFRDGTAIGGGANGTGSLVFVNVEGASGSSFDDLLIANDGLEHQDAWGGSEDWFGGPVLRGLAGNDTLLGGASADLLFGDLHAQSMPGVPDGDDELRGGAGNDTLQGAGGADRLEGQAGNDTLLGGTGADSFVFSQAPRADDADFISDFVSGTDKILLDRAVHSNLGAAGDFSAGDARFFAGNGAISGQTTSHRVIYDTSTGTLYYDADGSGVGAAHPIATLDGAPSLVARDISAFGEAGSPPPSSTMTGTSRDDSLVGSEGADTIDGLAGNDTVDGRGADDVLVGGLGNDSLLGGAGNDSTQGSDGDDTLDGGDGTDTLDGGAGNDSYIVTAGDAIVDSGGVDHVHSSTDWTLQDGLENLTMYASNEAADFGTGNDLDNTMIAIGGSAALSGMGGNDYLENEGWASLVGGDGNDTLSSATGFNHLNGGAGDDLILTRPGDVPANGEGGSIVGGPGNDAMFGGAANDRFELGADYGQDSIDGGAGRDAITFENAASGAIVSLAAGTASGGGAGGAGSATLASVEDVYGGDFGDRITGDSGANRLVGHSYFFFPPGDKDANDTLDGLGGNDTLEGGPGADQFMFSVAPGATNADQLTDFLSAMDKLVLDGSVHADIGPSGNFATQDARFWSSATGTAHDADDRVVYNTSTGELWYDANGSGAGGAALIATLQGAPTLAATDIVVINGGQVPPPPPPGSVINGTAGPDTLTGTAGNDTINGLDGNDLFAAGSTGGNDVINGGGGRDSIEFRERATSAVTVDFVAGTITGGSSGSITFSSVERVLTGNFNDVLNGNAAAQTLTGQGGSDTIWGAGGADTLWGATGSDAFVFREMGTANADGISDFATGVGQGPSGRCRLHRDRSHGELRRRGCALQGQFRRHGDRYQRPGGLQHLHRPALLRRRRQRWRDGAAHRHGAGRGGGCGDRHRRGLRQKRHARPHAASAFEDSDSHYGEFGPATTDI